METIHFPDDPRPPWLVHPVLALGNFDGLHRGHFKIIERVRRGAAEHGGTPMAMNFDPHPPRVLRPDKAPKLLMTKTQRLEALHPRLYRSVCDETGAVRRHVNLFVNTVHVRDRAGLDTPLGPGDVVFILPAVSGG